MGEIYVGISALLDLQYLRWALGKNSLPEFTEIEGIHGTFGLPNEYTKAQNLT